MGEVSEKPCIHTIPGMYYYEGLVLYNATPRWCIEPVRNFQFRDEDILITAYPKCGTSFIQEVVYLIANNVDVEAADKIPSFLRVPYMDLITSPEEKETQTVKALQMLEAVPQGQPRQMKSHFPVHFFLDQISSKKMKVVLGLRNVKDVLVSFFHFYRMNKALGKFPGTWEEFFTMFRNKQLLYGDYFEWVQGWWKASQTNSNILPVTYEDLKADPEKEIKKIAEFLGKTLNEDQIRTIIRKTDFKEMASKATTNYSQLPVFDFSVSPFMRKGRVGDWKNLFTEDQSNTVDKLIEENFKGTGLEFKYEL